jgi:Fe2+ transport system protein B
MKRDNKKIFISKSSNIMLLLFVTIWMALSMPASGTEQDKRTVSGVITDASGAALPGVTVLIKGTEKGTISDIDGKYSIEASPSDIIQFSFVGYLTRR